MSIFRSACFGLVFALLSMAVFGQSPALVYRAEFEQPVASNTTFSITVTSINFCRYPYSEIEQPPDYLVNGNQLEVTVYLRLFGENTNPPLPCVSANRTQVYSAPALQSGHYQMKLFARLYQDIGSGSFGVRRPQGEIDFQVADAVPITQIPATSIFSLALLLLGIFSAARWASGVSER
jgi:hypothetical protein